MNVAILGASGMLGAMVTDVFSKAEDLSVTATVRTEEQRVSGIEQYPEIEWVLYDAQTPEEHLQVIARHPYVINCIGITKPLIHSEIPSGVQRAIQVNALWPHQLGKAVSENGHKLLQIATDCVFSGRGGPYAEPSVPDAHDIYGKTKALGETRYTGVTHLRCSIIGPEVHSAKFLLEWVRQQPERAVLRGFEDHHWNGVTTLQFARICLGMVLSGYDAGPLVHVVPLDVVNKYQLLKILAEAYGRQDLFIDAFHTQHANMTLATHQPTLVADLWSAAGYDSAPTVEQMVQEVAAYRFSERAE